MELINPCNEAFVPLLEDIFDCEIKVPNRKDRKILVYHDLINKKIHTRKGDNYTICIGLSSYIPEVHFVFIWEVKDVISLILSPDTLPNNVTIVCNLQTHFQELITLGYKVLSVYDILGRNLPLIEKNSSEYDFMFVKKDGVSINPNSLSEDIFHVEALVKFNVNAFSPSDDNYSNEFCEVYQLASILGLNVYSTTNMHEIISIQTHLNKTT